jgi:predicted dehydrogenase
VSGERELLVAVVGLAFGRRVHIPGWRAVPGVTVAAVCARSGAADVAAADGIPRSTADWRELAEDPGLDIVSIATPPATHHEIALGALRAGKAVMCEKPLAVRQEDAEELAREASIPAAVNFSYRALVPFRLARERIAAGDVGDVHELIVRWHVRSRLGAPAWSWKDSLADGGGALATYGVHALDYSEWLVGRAVRLAASFELQTAERDGLPVTSDDACSLTLTLASGARATIDISLVAERRVHRVEVRGERGSIVLENVDPRDPVGAFTIARDDAPLPLLAQPHATVTDSDPRVEPFAVCAASLAAAVRGGGSVSPSFEDGLRAQRLVAAAHRSAAEGSEIAVPTNG